MRIIDCFTFNNELQLLKYRINSLCHIVDHFIIVEANTLHTGKEKPLYFDENRELFKEFDDKITHIIIQNMPYKFPNIDFNKSEQWINEKYQRQCISAGINHIGLIDEDIIIIGDLDEIPDPNTLIAIKNKVIDVTFNSLEMDFYYYNLNTRFTSKWYHAKILSYNDYKKFPTIEKIRKTFDCETIKNGGWHLSYFGDEIFIKNKIDSAAHQEYNNDNNKNIENIKKNIENNMDLFGRCDMEIKNISICDNKYLPYMFDTYLQGFFSI